VNYFITYTCTYVRDGRPERSTSREQPMGSVHMHVSILGEVSSSRYPHVDVTDFNQSPVLITCTWS
jgi:hypothetical protein